MQIHVFVLVCFCIVEFLNSSLESCIHIIGIQRDSRYSILFIYVYIATRRGDYVYLVVVKCRKCLLFLHKMHNFNKGNCKLHRIRIK